MTIHLPENHHAPLGALTMKSIYFKTGDILQFRVCEKQIVRKVSQDWHTNISYAKDSSVVEIVLLDAKKSGALPVNYKSAT